MQQDVPDDKAVYVVTCESPINQKAITGTGFVVDEDGTLDIYDGREVVAVFAAGAWKMLRKNEAIVDPPRARIVVANEA